MRFSSFLASLAIAGLVACSGAQSAVPTVSGAPANVSGTLTLRIQVPRIEASRSAHPRHPHYISPATKGMTIAIAGPTTLTKTVALLAGTNTLTLALAPCSTKNCYTATIGTYDAVACVEACLIPAGAHELSADQKIAFTVAKGAQNVASFTLGGIPKGITVSPIRPGYLQGDARRLHLWGPSTQRISVLALDADGDAIVGPGAPTISAKSSSATLALAQPATATPNLVGLTAVTTGTPAAVTPGTVKLTLTATPAAHSGASAISIAVPVVVAHSVLYLATAIARIDMYYDGNTSSPNAAITGANTMLDGHAAQLAVDANGTIYVAQNESQGQILAFPAGSNGNVAPSANINGASTLIDHAGGIAIGNGEIYLSNVTPGLLEWGIGASGNISATGSISGSNTSLSGPSGLALDSNGTLYVANSGANSVIAFPSDDSGNPTPSIAIAGANTNLDTPYAVAFGTDDSLYVSGSNGSIERFAPGANGNATPEYILSGAATTLPTYIYSLALDANGTLYAGGGATYLWEFAAGAHGNVAPIKTFIASANVYGIAVVP